MKLRPYLLWSLADFDGTGLTLVFRCSLQSRQATAGIVLRLGHDTFFSDHFQCVIRLISCHRRLYKLDTDNVDKLLMK
jgi:hypothetical protein